MIRYTEVQKIKGDPLDLYRCRECWRVWKSTARKIGHTEETCERRIKSGK